MSDLDKATDTPNLTASPAAGPVAASSGAAVPESVSEPPAGKFDALVNLWFAECIQGTAVGRNTEAYNAAYAALDELKRRLNQEN